MCRRRERITGKKRCSRATSPPQLVIRTPSHPVSAVHNTETIGCKQMRSNRPTVQSEDASKSLDLPAPLREESLIDADDPTRVSATRPIYGQFVLLPSSNSLPVANLQDFSRREYLSFPHAVDVAEHETGRRITKSAPYASRDDVGHDSIMTSSLGTPRAKSGSRSR